MQIGQLYFSGDWIRADCLRIFQIGNGIIMAKQFQCCNLPIRYANLRQVFYSDIRVFQYIMQ